MKKLDFKTSFKKTKFKPLFVALLIVVTIYSIVKVGEITVFEGQGLTTKLESNELTTELKGKQDDLLIAETPSTKKKPRVKRISLKRKVSQPLGEISDQARNFLIEYGLIMNILQKIY